ncbi:MAG TPA: zeta toxin family protein [Candidatus Binatia bacterium]|nr:zeta toxin family protein [Candidatus Binatia bacterium]
MPADRTPTIWVIAGANGAGKSSIIGQMLRDQQLDYYNPDEHTELLLTRNPGLARSAANELAWHSGKKRLETAIAARTSFVFETTLGGRTITTPLMRAAMSGIAVKKWFVALDSADRHVARVRARVATGGHDIPEARIRERYDRSRVNLARLLPHVCAVKVFDNSQEASTRRGPAVKLLLDYAGGRVRACADLASMPKWAKPLVAAAIKAART